MLGAVALGVMLLGSPALVASPSFSVENVEEGKCDKCGKKECKGCEAKSEAKGKEGEKAKSCASKGEGKSCCSKGGKKEAKKEMKEEAKK